MNEEITSLLVEIDPEKKVVYIHNYLSKINDKSMTKRFRNKYDIVRIFRNYIFKNVELDDEEYRNYRRYESRKFKK